MPDVETPEAPEKPAEAPETPEPAAPETPEPETPPAPESGDSAEAKARREARNLREKLKEMKGSVDDAVSAATASRDERITDLESQLLEAQAQLAAVGKFRNPRDITHFIDVHSTDVNKLDDLITKVLKERPYLAAVEAGAVPQGQQNGNGHKSDADMNEWLRDVIQKKG